MTFKIQDFPHYQLNQFNWFNWFHRFNKLGRFNTFKKADMINKSIRFTIQNRLEKLNRVRMFG